MAVFTDWRLVPEQETDVATRLADADRRLRAILLRDPAAAPTVRAGPGRGRRGGADVVARAVLQVTDPSLRPSVQRAWREVLELRWRLALSEIRVAHVEARRRGGGFIPAEDLVHEGLLGLVHAASRYEPSRKIRFSTYARWWVRAFVTRAIVETGRHVRLPSGAEEQLRRLHVAIREHDRRGVPWDISSIATEVGVEVERAHLLLGQGSVVSLDDLETTWDLHLARSREVPQDDALAAAETARLVHDALDDVLDERQRFVVHLRFGFDGQEELTLQEVGKRLNLTKERVRQIERKALGRLAARGGLRRLA